MSRNNVRGPTSALTDFLKVKSLRSSPRICKVNSKDRHQALPPLLSPEEYERRHKLMTKLSRVPVQLQLQLLPQLALVQVQVDQVCVEQGREELVENHFFISQPCHQLKFISGFWVCF
jgi:hypothetical protein